MISYFMTHWIVSLIVVSVLMVLILWLAYQHGRNVGDERGYTRGCRDGQNLMVEGTARITG